MWLSLGGSLFADEPTRFEVLPGALRVAVL
jgi:hypothetical protein